jgi:hypothetical protein
MGTKPNGDVAWRRGRVAVRHGAEGALSEVMTSPGHRSVEAVVA